MGENNHIYIADEKPVAKSKGQMRQLKRVWIKGV